MEKFTVDHLRAMLLACAGRAEGAAWDGDILDRTFDELGYDSIAMFEVAGHIHRQYGTRLGDGAVAELRTPRAFIARVNELLTRSEEELVP